MSVNDSGDMIVKDLLLRKVTLLNEGKSDAEDSRQSELNFMGATAAGQNHVLGSISVAHDGSNPDQKGKLILGVNRGDQGDDCSSALEITSEGIVKALGDVHISGGLVVHGKIRSDETSSDRSVLESSSLTLNAASAPSEGSAHGGGLILKGVSDKRFTWDQMNQAWNSSENVNLAAGKSVNVANRKAMDENAVYLPANGAVYFGDPGTEGMWRMTTSNGQFLIQQRVGGQWQSKSTILG